MKANDFSRRFEVTYGPGAIDKFKELVEDPNNTLADVGRHFGFSKQYAHKIFRRIYGYPYTRVLEKKRQARKIKVNHGNRISPPSELLQVVNRIKSLGLSAVLKKKAQTTTVSVNGYRLVLRTSKRPFRMGNKDHYRITHIYCSRVRFDYLICLCKESAKNTFFVLPQGLIDKPNITLIPSASPHESKYAPFKEAWHMLHSERGRNNTEDKTSALDK